MIAQLREAAQEFERRGVQVLVVEANDAYRLRYLMRRVQQKTKTQPARPIDKFAGGAPAWMDESGKPALTIVTDAAATAAASYGVAHGFTFLAGGESFHRPATFLIDRDGMIRFIADYKDTEGLAAAELLQVLDGLEEKRTLIAGLKTKKAELSDAVERVLQTPPDAASVLPVLSLALGDNDADVRAGAAAALCWIGFRAAGAVPQLTKALSDADHRVRFQSAETLARIGPEAAPAVPALILAMQRADMEVRSILGQALRESPRPTQVIFPTAGARIAISEQDVRFRGITIAALERIGAAAAAGLIDALANKDARVRLSVTDVLGRIAASAPRIGPALGKLLRQDKDARVREAAAMALHRLRHFDVSLVVALRDEETAVREAAASALERTGGLGHWEAVIALVAALEDGDPRVRDGAFYALDHRADGTVPTLIEALKSGDPQVRLRAAEIMAHLWDKAISLQGGRLEMGLRTEGVPALRAAIKDSDARVSKAATAALLKIERPASR